MQKFISVSLAVLLVFCLLVGGERRAWGYVCRSRFEPAHSSDYRLSRGSFHLLPAPAYPHSIYDPQAPESDQPASHP